MEANGYNTERTVARMPGRGRVRIQRLFAISLLAFLGIGMPAGASGQTFDDVPPDYWAFSFIENLAASGVTSGCGDGNYCPKSPVSRSQMAVFLERGIHGSAYSPPAATGNVFLDVGAGDFAANFIEQLYQDGITAGCDNNNYCPNATVTRDQMAVFLLRAKHGSGYSPPPATGVFGDVDLSYWAVAWIEQLAAEGITAGCGGDNYCPQAPVNRDQMAVFLVRTFSIDNNVQAAGYYKGTFFSTVTNTATDVEAIVGANNRFHAWEITNFDSGYWGSVSVVVQMIRGTLAAEIWDSQLEFPDGSTFGTIDIAGNVVEHNNSNGVFSGVGDSGTFDLDYKAAVSQRPSTLSDASGEWVFTDGRFGETVTIDESGSLTLTATDGCAAQGQITVLDPLLNGFSIEYDLTCPPGVNEIPNGVRTGVAYIDDVSHTDVWLIAAGSIGNNGTLASWSRPRATANETSKTHGGLFSKTPRAPARRRSRR